MCIDKPNFCTMMPCWRAPASDITPAFFGETSVRRDTLALLFYTTNSHSHQHSTVVNIERNCLSFRFMAWIVITKGDTTTMAPRAADTMVANDEHQTPHKSLIISTCGGQRISFIDLEDAETDNPRYTAVARGPIHPSSAKLRIQFPQLTKQQEWDHNLKPGLANILNYQQLILFRSLYDSGLTSTKILNSLAYIASFPRINESAYLDELDVVASHLSIGRTPQEVRLASVKTLMECLSPIVAVWQTRDAVVEGTLDFMLHRNVEWEFMDHTEMNLILELRALCLRHIDKEKERIARVVKTGDTAAVIISASAKIVEAGMRKSASVLSGKLETAGEQVKGWVKPEDYPLFIDRNAVVAMAFSNAARRASEGARDGTLVAVNKIREVSTQGLVLVTDRLHGRGLAARMSPECAETFRAAGKVGMATLGAAAVVGEALVETSRALVKKTGAVTAGIVEHKYGTSAGQVVSDAGETAENLVRAVGNVALFETTVMAKSIAKNAGKVQLDHEISKAKDSLHLLEIQAAGMIHQVLGVEWVGQKAIEMKASQEGYFTRAYTELTDVPETETASTGFIRAAEHHAR